MYVGGCDAYVLWLYVDDIVVGEMVVWISVRVMQYKIDINC